MLLQSLMRCLSQGKRPSCDHHVMLRLGKNPSSQNKVQSPVTDRGNKTPSPLLGTVLILHQLKLPELDTLIRTSCDKATLKETNVQLKLSLVHSLSIFRVFPEPSACLGVWSFYNDTGFKVPQGNFFYQTVCEGF